MAPLVSIGLPVRNGERYLPGAIKSALRQSFEDFELVVSDNASTDATESICRAFAGQDPRVRYERSETDVGAAGNHNRCIDLSTGRYFMWLAHDDLLGERQLERCLDALEHDPAVSMAFPRLTYIDAEGAPAGSQSMQDLSLLAEDPGARAWQLVRQELASDDIYSVFYALFRRDALQRTRRHGTYLAADQVLVFELVLAGKLVQVAGAEFVRRRHEESSMLRHRRPAERAAWFDTSARRRVHLAHWTLFAQHYRAIWRMHLPWRSSLRATAAVSYRALREWRNLGGDFRDAARAVRSGDRPQGA